MSEVFTIPNETTRQKVTDIFTREEIRMLTERSDLMGFAAVGFTWGVILLTFAALVWAANQSLYIAVPVFLASLIVLGGRHLALAILHHEAAHGTLFKTRWLNEEFADWVVARPIWNDVAKYRKHHLVHHAKTSSNEDTDISLSRPFPTTRTSLARKFLRDVSGLTGVKFLIGRLLMDASILKWTVANDYERLPQDGRSALDVAITLLRNMTPMLLVNAVLVTLLWASGHAWLYGVWVLAYLTPYPLFLRIRSMAEHACTERTPDMFRNTRSTQAGFLARATVAPIRVNYHIEHHVMASVPYFRLPLMHRMLRERGAVSAPPGYWKVLDIVTTPKAA
jgi:fatty acid desaturase